MISTRKKKLQAAVLIFVIAIVAYASASGPDARYTGAPGDIGNCVNCHDSFENANVGPGSVTITNAPAVYTPGQQYTLTVTVQQGGQSRFGFQLTAVDSNGDRAGTLAPVSSDSQLNALTGTGDRQYIQHSSTGTSPTSSGRRIWQIRWTAPSTDVGTVTFYVAGNAANNNGTNQGDYIYTNRLTTESPTSNVTVALVSNPDDQTLVAGSQFLIDWSATGLSNVDSYELRYSTDDGATFPITNLIFSTTDANITEYNWTVPNTPTTQGRLRLQAATKSGSAVEVRSGRFTITGTGGPQIPVIASVEIIGKHLYVNGSNFKDDADVYMNDVKQKTKNDSENPTGRLKCKKLGKKIDPGQTVNLVVKNPDGTESASFLYQRPL
ncbi:MAG: choice-of-anchor V domain-containing protein [Acidobacteriota bacterium]